MSSLIYLQIAGKLTQYGVFLTVLTNTLVTHLTFSGVKRISLAYKRLISCQAILGILLSLTELLIHPFLHSFNASYIFFSVSFASHELMPLGSLLLAMYSLIYMNIICSLALQFIYRYFVVMDPKKLKLFHGWRTITWISYILILMAIWILSLLKNLPDKFSRSYLKEEISVNYDQDISYIPSYQFIVYDKNGTLRFNTLLGVFGFSSVILIQYVIIIFCGVHIHLKIQEIVSSTSPNAHRLHRQLFRTLVLQITVPSFFYNSPVLFLYIIAFLDLKCSIPSGVIICVISFYPAIDSFILIWMVSEYNVAMRRLITRFLARLSEMLKREDSEDDGEESKTRTSTAGRVI